MRTADGWNAEETVEFGIAKLLEAPYKCCSGRQQFGEGGVDGLAWTACAQTQLKRTFSRLEK